MKSSLIKKEKQAIRLLQSIKDTPVEVCFSGGKDSEVILALAQMAGCNYRAIYKNTTIDPPGTIAHCRRKGCEIVQPEMSFLKIVEKKCIPTRRARFCCSILKEYKIMDNAILGVRRSESQKRAQRYIEPEICRVYSNREKAHHFMPLLEWDNADIKEFITQNNIQCHPLYYDEDGNFNVERRLGCIGCPLKSDNGLSDYIKYPKMFLAITKSLKKWWDKPREKELQSKIKFGDMYGLLYNNMFCDSYKDFINKKGGLFGKRDYKKEFEYFFQLELP